MKKVTSYNENSARIIEPPGCIQNTKHANISRIPMLGRKAYRLYLLTLLLFACTTTPNSSRSAETLASTGKPEQTAPFWYTNRAIPLQEGILYGYGEGATSNEASARAMNDLALQIRVRITSELLLNESETGGEYFIRIATRIEQSTQLELFGAKRIKQERIDSRHFVAYRYDNRLLRIRALELATKQSPSPASANSFKSHLPFARFLENNGHAVRFIIDAVDGVYFLSVGSSRIPISPADFRDNFITNIHPERWAIQYGKKNGLSVPHLPPGTLLEGQLFRVSYTPAATGYLSLLYIDNTGMVQTWLRNEPVETNTAITFPNPTTHDGLLASRAAVNGTSTDMLLAVESPAPLDFIHIIPTVQEIVADPDNSIYYQFGSLLEQLVDLEQSAKTIQILEN